MYSGVPKIMPVLVSLRPGCPPRLDVAHLGDAEVDDLDEVLAVLALAAGRCSRASCRDGRCPCRARRRAPRRTAARCRRCAAATAARSSRAPRPGRGRAAAPSRRSSRPPCVTPKSEMSMMCSWPMREALLASWRKRSTTSGRLEKSSRSTLRPTRFSITHVLGLVDDAHAALADLADDAVAARERGADQWVLITLAYELIALAFGREARPVDGAKDLAIGVLETALRTGCDCIGHARHEAITRCPAGSIGRSCGGDWHLGHYPLRRALSSPALGAGHARRRPRSRRARSRAPGPRHFPKALYLAAPHAFASVLAGCLAFVSSTRRWPTRSPPVR